MDTSKLKPFNLERALAGDSVVTRDGREVYGIHVYAGAHYGRVVAQIQDTNSPSLFYPCGSYTNGGESINDLMMAPKIRTVWVNLIPDSNKTAKWFSTEEAANTDHYIMGSPTFPRLGNRAYPIEIEE